MLFRSTEELKTALGSLHQSMDFDTLASFVDQAELLHLQPYVGPELLAELHAALDEAPTPAQAALIKHLRRALAYYVVLEAAPMVAVAFSDLGLSEQSADRAAPARQWVYNNFVDSAGSNADTLLDTALFWLESRASEFPAWRNSDAYTVSKELFLHSAYDLSKFVNVAGSRRTYLALRPYLRRIEELEVLPLLGPERFAELKARILTPALLTPADRELWAAIKPVVAHKALAAAVAELPLQVSSAGVRVLVDNDGIRERRAAAPAQIENMRRNAEQLGTQYFTRLAAFTDSLLAAGQEPRRKQLPDNTGLKSFRV